MSPANLIVEQSGGIAVVQVSRPKVLNALNAETIGELDCAFAGLERDAGVRGVILTGGGSNALGMVEIAEQVFDAPTRLGYLDHGQFGGLAEQVRGPEWAVASGLALSSMRSQVREFSRNGRRGSKVAEWFENFRDKFR